MWIGDPDRPLGRHQPGLGLQILPFMEQMNVYMIPPMAIRST